MSAAPAFKLHGISMSTCVKRVGVVAAELDVPYELVQIDFAGGQHKSAEYLATKNPFGQVPAAVCAERCCRVRFSYSHEFAGVRGAAVRFKCRAGFSLCVRRTSPCSSLAQSVAI